MEYDLRSVPARDIREEFWRRFDLGEIPEEELLYQLQCSYPEEVLAPLKAYIDQPIVNRTMLRRWVGEIPLAIGSERKE